MKPWCAEGNVPTAANLHLYRGWNSHVGGIAMMSFSRLWEKDEGEVDLAHALSLLQSIMTPEDFPKYQGMVAPKQKQKKIWEQALADRVKNLKRLQSQ